jgi:hypothetical protein
MTWSLNIWGDDIDAASILAINAMCEVLMENGTITGGSLNTTDAPQVTYGPQAAPPAEVTGGPETTPPAETAPEQEDTAAAPEEGEEDAPHPQAGPLAAATLDELEAELNRRSAEGQNYSRDDSAIQNAHAADIEAEIASRIPADDADAE